MPSDQTTLRLFEKLDEVLSNQGDLRERLARVETKQDSHYTENDTAHTQMTASMVEIMDRVENIEEKDDAQQSELDTQRGKRQIMGKVVEYTVMLLSGGVLVAIGGWIAKMMGILR